MKKVKYYFKYNLFIIELCCLNCHFNNIHKGHKVIQIEDENSLKKENISLELSFKEFNDNSKKTVDLKNTIEKEINKINNSYDKVNKEITKSYEIKHEKLTNEEYNLKEKLQNEVTKIKEKLEILLTESNKFIKISEKINKGIQILEKEKEKNMIKTLSYVSKINKSQKEMKILFGKLMKNINISFQEDKNNIVYEEYYFNGISIDKDIEISDINMNSFKLNWKLQKLNNDFHINHNQINYKVEIKKENSKENYNIVYEGNNNTCLIDNLKKNTIYEIKITLIYNNLISDIKITKNIKTNECDSIILKESKKQEEYLKKIYEWCGYSNLELLYRGTRDGSGSNYFHFKCDNQGPTICLYQNDKNNIFGGFASISWTSDGNYHSAPDSFLFTLTNIHKTEPAKFPNTDKKYSVYHHSNDGPSFGYFNDMGIYQDFLNQDSYTNFPCRYQDTLGKGKSVFTGNMNNDINYFKMKEIEVFKVSK